MYPKEAQGTLNHLYTPYSGMGFIVPYLSGSQTALSLIQNVNEFMESDPYFEISIYSASKDLPIMVPNCAVYNPLDVRDNEGPLIAVEPMGCQALVTMYHGPKYYYAYNPLLLLYIPKPELERIVQAGVKFFTRSDAHAKFLKKNLNLDTISIRVPDFDITIIKEIVNG